MIYNYIWDEIEEEINYNNGYAARQIGNIDVCDVYLAIESKTRYRKLIINFNEISIDIYALPTWNGLSIEKKELTIGTIPNTYLILGNNSLETNDIYDSVISNIVEKFKCCENVEDIKVSMIKTLKKWQFYFDKFGGKGLSAKYQRGLYGELWMLRSIINIQPQRKNIVISGWNGFNGSDHDFQYRDKAIEFKTTKSKQHHKVHISSEYQLDDRNLSELYLGVLIVRESNNVGESLNEIIQDIRDTLINDFTALEKFNEGLYKSGYIDVQSKKYVTRYNRKELKIFKVENKFPRILPISLPEGIGDIKYTVMLSACKEYENSFSTLLEELSIVLEQK